MRRAEAIERHRHGSRDDVCLARDHHVLDIWESEEHFGQFITTRIEPVLKGELGVKSDPQPEFHPLHRRFIAPGISGAA
jgi:hypothetical protein